MSSIVQKSTVVKIMSMIVTLALTTLMTMIVVMMMIMMKAFVAICVVLKFDDGNV